MAELAVAVVDDDSAVGRTIEGWLRSERPDSRISVFESGEELMLSPSLFDIIYLDVRMDGASGIETAERLKERRSDTIFIFISGLRDHVFEALDLHPFHYILKPLEHEKFVRIFREACEEVEARSSETERRLLISSRRGSVAVPFSEILYVERGPRRLDVHTKNGNYEMYGSLNQLEAELGSGFYRCHRAFLVNLAWVRSYRTDCIVLRDGTSVFLSKKKHNDFVKQYMWYLGGISGHA